MLLHFPATSYSGKYCLQMVQSQNHQVPLCYYPDGFIAAGKPFCCLILGTRLTHGMVLLKISPVPRCKNSTSITLTDWFAVVSFKSQPGLGRMDRKAWSPFGVRQGEIPFLKGKADVMEDFCLGVRSSVPSHLSEEMEKCSAFQQEGDLLQVPLTSLLTHWHELFHPLAKKTWKS